MTIRTVVVDDEVLYQHFDLDENKLILVESVILDAATHWGLVEGD